MRYRSLFMPCLALSLSLMSGCTGSGATEGLDGTVDGNLPSSDGKTDSIAGRQFTLQSHIATTIEYAAHQDIWSALEGSDLTAQVVNATDRIDYSSQAIRLSPGAVSDTHSYLWVQVEHSLPGVTFGQVIWLRATSGSFQQAICGSERKQVFASAVELDEGQLASINDNTTDMYDLARDCGVTARLPVELVTAPIPVNDPQGLGQHGEYLYNVMASPGNSD